MPKEKGGRLGRPLPRISGAPDPPQTDASLGDDSMLALETPFVIPLSDEDRCHVRLAFTERKELVEFAVMQRALIEGQWREVARYDTSDHHGDGLHLHCYTLDGRETIKPGICDLDDMDEAYDVAIDAILNGWQEHRRRFVNG